MNHQGLHWNVHCVANVGLRKRLNLCKRGFKIYDLLVFSLFCLRLDADRHSTVLKIGVNNAIAPRVFCNVRQPAANFESRNLKCLLAKRC